MNNVSLSEMGGIAVAEVIKSSFNSLMSYGGAKINNLYLRIFEDFEPYMLECYRRNRFVRILCQDDDDVDILDIYVQTTFRHSGEIYKDHEIAFSVVEGENVIITGAGGAGKTFFMRKMWLDILSEQKKAPIFVELRKLNELTSTSLPTFVRASISDKLPEEVFRTFCNEGRFVFIFDGFDELPKDRHDSIQDQILKLAETYQKCSIVVSGRPDSRFHGWNSFRCFEAEPFTLKQTTELCEKIPFESDYRKVFIKTLTSSFYRKYKSFLSNPLLSIMMMMTFRRNMDIPKKMGIFYDEAFSTLYQWHDSTKAFKRQKTLDIQQFRRSFGAFSLLSYAREKYDFSRTELDEFIEKSSKLVEISTSKDLVLDDYERNVNLIRQDGLRYYFIHRSFQEYFAAWSLINLFPHKFSDFATKIEGRYGDSVISMCFDLHRSHVIKTYIEPRYRKLVKELKLTPKYTEKLVWEHAITSFRIHMGKDEENQYRRIGFGLNANKEFMVFYRNISNMMHESHDPNENLGFMKPFIRSDLFNAASDWTSNLEFTKDEITVDAKPNFSDNTIILSYEPHGDGIEHRSEIAMSNDDARLLKLYAKEIAKMVSDISQWCKSEIEFAQTTDSAVEDMFFND